MRLLSYFPAGEKHPPRDPQCPPGAIDPTDYYNAGLTQGWEHNQENNLSELQHGAQAFAGVKFDVRGLIQLASEYIQREKFDFPEQVRQINVGRPCRRLQFLHAAITGGGEHQEKQVGSYLVRFSNGQSWEISLVYGRDLLDWWWVPYGPQAAKDAVLAWAGSIREVKTSGYRRRLFKSTWESPLLDTEVVTIRFCLQHGGAGAIPHRHHGRVEKLGS
ncbi:MAG: hypothetical protein L0Z53_03985 [Acidobacteriales bacterium]|nr:hypothetical protein [Terriglobales bacterium]